MKDMWKQEIHAFEEANHCGVGKGDFAELFRKAFQQAFTPDTIKAAFRATGIHPYNASVIHPEQMRPSEPTSTKSSFPTLQTSPVCAFMSAYHNFHPTAADLDPLNYIAPSTSQPSPPLCSPRTRHHDAILDPSLLESPSKRMRMAVSALASTSTGQALVSRTPINVSFRISSPVLETPPIPPPPLSPKNALSPSQMSRAQLEESYRNLLTKHKEERLLINRQNGIIQRTNAQMVIQNLYCEKLNEKLNVKENKEPDERTILPVLRDGKGRHWTEDNVIQSLREVQAAKDAEVADKDRRKAERMAKAEQRKLAEAEWKRVVTEHESAKTMHANNVKCLRAAGVKVRDLPKPPVRELQASVYARFGIGPRESEDDVQHETVSLPVTQGGHS